MKSLFRLSILLIIALNLVGTLFGLFFDYLLFAAGIGALVGGFPLMGKGFRKAASIFLALGAAMLLFGRHPLDLWVKAATSMTNIIAIVAVMQSFAIPIKVGAYDEAIKSWMDGRLKGASSLFIFLTFTTHLLTSFLSMGSVPVTVSLFEPTLKTRIPDWKRFFARAATRGYVLSVLWSPGAVNLSLVAQATGLSWSQVFVPGFLLAFLGMGASSLAEFIGSRGKNSLQHKAEDRGDRSRLGREVHVLGIVVLFITLVALLERLKIGVSSGRTVLAGLLLALAWILSQAKRPGMKTALKAHWREGLLKVGDIAPFFVAMGIFSTALEASGYLEAAASFLKTAADFLGPASVILIAGIIAAASLVGLHPFITIVLFGKVLSYVSLPIPPITIALGLSVGGAAAYMITPFAGMIMIMSRLIGVKAVDIALRWNWRFSLAFLAGGLAYAFAWGALFG
ncbi:MAG: hypothetical protein RBT72_05025 [Spirochaetia bacterium]|jgi:hypothetical protein|nr:hypothetical protein [Spirochaetia bacterium]